MKRQNTIHKSYQRDVDSLRDLVAKSPRELGPNGHRLYPDNIKSSARNLLMQGLSPKLLSQATGLSENILYSWRRKLREKSRFDEGKARRPLVKILDVVPPIAATTVKRFLKIDWAFNGGNCSINLEF